MDAPFASQVSILLRRRHLDARLGNRREQRGLFRDRCGAPAAATFPGRRSAYEICAVQYESAQFAAVHRATACRGLEPHELHVPGHRWLLRRKRF